MVPNRSTPYSGRFVWFKYISYFSCLHERVLTANDCVSSTVLKVRSHESYTEHKAHAAPSNTVDGVAEEHSVPPLTMHQ